MALFNFIGSPDKQRQKSMQLYIRASDEFEKGNYTRAETCLSEAADMMQGVYEKTRSAVDRSLYCKIMMEESRTLFVMGEKGKAYSYAFKVYELLKNEDVRDDNLEDCKTLRFACEIATGGAQKAGAIDKAREYLEKHLDICKKIFEKTGSAEDYIELADSYDYHLSLPETPTEGVRSAEKMKEIYDTLHRQFPQNSELAEKADYANEALADALSKRIEASVSIESFRAAADDYKRLAGIKMEYALSHGKIGFEDLDDTIENFHRAADNYVKAGDTVSAMDCIENAIKLRSSIVERTDSDIARSRLSYSYMMAAKTEPSADKQKEYAKNAYDLLDGLAERHPEEARFSEYRALMSEYLH